jgi:hypothetical protein
VIESEDPVCFANLNDTLPSTEISLALFKLDIIEGKGEG